jgi:hypothetical protein
MTRQVLVFAIASALLVAAPSLATPQSDPHAEADQTAEAQAAPEEYGASYSILQIPAAAFTSRYTESGLVYEGAGLVFDLGPAHVPAKYWAPVTLPAGAMVTFLDLYACDHSPTGHVTVSLDRYPGSDVPLVETLATVSSAQGDGWGCGYWAAAVNHVINNNVRYDGGSQYVITLSFGAPGLDPGGDQIAWNYFKGVDLWWKRQVSPGPAAATFADVPTTSPYFKFVEALAAAGITSGCGGGNYCPNGAVTRGQMAIYLATALGLHFPF